MGSRCFKQDNSQRRQKQVVVAGQRNFKPPCEDEISEYSDKDRKKTPNERRFQQKKPVILFYGFDGPFQCELVTDKPQLVLSFPKPNCERAIKWSGSIKDNKLQIGKHTYPYLFWESVSLQPTGLKPHLRINTEDMSQTVFELLLQMGLSEEESTNFVTFWIHQWSNQSSWLVHVASQESINKLYPLKISPQPSQIKRFYLLFGKDISHIPLQPLKITKWKMTNEKTVVEWGASLYNFNDSS